MQITFLSCTVETVKTGKGSYEKAAVAYKDAEGKIQGKNLVSFSAQKVLDVLKRAQPGTTFEVVTEKDDKGYWQWKDISGSSAGAPPDSTPAKATPKSTYETPEERAKKQVYIVRQSSLSSAIALLEANGGKKNTKEEVVELAKYFEAYVFGEEFDDGSVFSMKDDIPFETEEK